MAKVNAATWGVIGAISGTILLAAFQSRYTLLGAILGAILGYMLGKSVK